MCSGLYSQKISDGSARNDWKNMCPQVAPTCICVFASEFSEHKNDEMEHCSEVMR